MPGGHPGHDALTKRIPSVRAEVAASPFARSVLDSIVPCPHGRDTYLLKEQVFYHACCRAGCWVRTSNVWTWLKRMMNHPDQTSAALREPSNQKAMLKFRIEELRDAAGARDETRLACEEFLKDWSDSKYVECVPRPADATHTLRTMGKKPADGEAPKSYKCSALRGFRIEPPPHLGDVPLKSLNAIIAQFNAERHAYDPLRGDDAMAAAAAAAAAAGPPALVAVGRAAPGNHLKRGSPVTVSSAGAAAAPAKQEGRRRGSNQYVEKYGPSSEDASGAPSAKRLKRLAEAAERQGGSGSYDGALSAYDVGGVVGSGGAVTDSHDRVDPLEMLAYISQQTSTSAGTPLLVAQSDPAHAAAAAAAAAWPPVRPSAVASSYALPPPAAPGPSALPPPALPTLAQLSSPLVAGGVPAPAAAAAAVHARALGFAVPGFGFAPGAVFAPGGAGAVVGHGGLGVDIVPAVELEAGVAVIDDALASGVGVDDAVLERVLSA